MLRLDATTKIMQLIATGTADVTVSGLNVTSAAAPGFTEVTAATATTQTIAAAPAASTVKQIDHISIKNTQAGANTFTVQMFNSSGSVTTVQTKATLAADETLEYTHAHGWRTMDATGSAKTGTAGWVIAAGKIGTLSNTLTLAGTDGTTMTFPTTNATIARTDAAQTFTGNQTITGGISTAGNVGIGTAINPAYGLSIASTGLTGGTQGGFGVNATINDDATLGAGLVLGGITKAASFTLTAFYGLQLNDMSLGSGSAVTTQNGLYINDQTKGSTNVGIRNLVSAGTNKWGYYGSGTADNYFAGAVKIGATSKLYLDGSGAGDTYITESSANVLDMYAGGVNTLRLSATAATITGTGTITGAFGCNSKTAQTAYASGGALASYSTGAFGLDSDAHMSALHAMVVSIREALINNGIMS